MTMEDFKQIPLHAKNNAEPTMLENVADIKMINTPTEVDHHQLLRVIDLYVSPKGEDLGALAKQVQRVIDANQAAAEHARAIARIGGRDATTRSRALRVGLSLSIVLVYLILMAQFASFSDPFSSCWPCRRDLPA